MGNEQVSQKISNTNDDGTIKKSIVKALHDQQLCDGKNQKQNTTKLVNILGGIDKILSHCLSGNCQYPLNEYQIKRIHEIISTNYEPKEIEGKRNRTIFESNNEYTQNPQRLNGVDDLSKLIYFDIENVSKNVEFRYCEKPQKMYFTSIKDINVLLSINPYKQLSIYNQDVMNEFNMHSKKGILSNILHPYGVATNSFIKMKKNKLNQSIIILGETGSGKTEMSKLIIKYLANTKNNDETVTERIIALSNVLESFGNAKTVRNDNSSRFGKFIKLFYSISENAENTANILGAHLKTYLFEKSRLINQPLNESNFHIFYMLQNVLRNSDNNEYGLTSINQFNYLNHKECLPSNDETLDLQKFEELKASLKALAIDDNLQEMIWKMILGILYLGNINFKREGDGQTSIDRHSTSSIETASSLLGITTKALKDRLTTRTSKLFKKNIVFKLQYDDAHLNRDCMAKGMYEKLFLWICEKANDAFEVNPEKVTETNDISKEDLRFIAILDSIGYQNYINSLEQFCINYSNEKFQQLFNNYIINNDEEIQWKPECAQFDENYFQLMDNKMYGFFALLDSECKAPRPNIEVFMTELIKRHKVNSIFHKTSKPGSGDCIWIKSIKKKKKRKSRAKMNGILINHYNDDVTYDLQQFLSKNMEAMHSDTLQMMRKSSNTVFKITGSISKKKKKKSITALFNTDLKQTLKTLQLTEPHFIFCLNSNHDKSSTIWNKDIVQRQLSGYGIHESIKTLKYRNLFISACIRELDIKVNVPNDIIHLIYRFSAKYSEI